MNSVGANIFRDGTQWVNNGWRGNNGWGALTMTGTNGDLVYVADTGTGVTTRNYTENQFLSKARFTVSGVTGNVGMGISPSATARLAVNGTLKATEVIVTTAPGADYVFDPEYRLTPLGEVAEYVRENRHLPGIPAAVESADKGVSLGEMQAKLLAKIEELTLHMIRAEERNARLERGNDELLRRMAAFDLIQTRQQ